MPSAVHAGEHDLAGPQPLDFAGPGHRFQPRRHAAAVDVDFPHLAAVLLNPLGIDIHHDALAAEPPGRLVDELRIFARPPS